MKNVMNNSKKVLIMVAIMATVFGYANDVKFKFVNSDAKRTVLTLGDVKAGNLFSIKDENGIVLYKESILSQGIYQKGFDFTDLPNGSYFFELDKDVEVTSIPFSIKDGIVTYEKTEAITSFKPVTVVKSDMVYITKLSLEQKPLEIEVYYDNGDYKKYQLIYSETISNTKKIERAYKISNFEKGKYKIVYKTEGRVYTEYL